MWIQAEAAEQLAIRKPEGSDLNPLGPRGLQEHRGQWLASAQLNSALIGQGLEFTHTYPSLEEPLPPYLSALDKCFQPIDF